MEPHGLHPEVHGSAWQEGGWKQRLRVRHLGGDFGPLKGPTFFHWTRDRDGRWTGGTRGKGGGASSGFLQVVPVAGRAHTHT